MPINPIYRDHLIWLRALAADDEGREVYVGLSFEESEEYSILLDTNISVRNTALSFAEIDGLRHCYLELYNKHELARITRG